MMDFRGAIKLLPKQDILKRYQNWAQYRQALNQAIDESITQRFLLEEDRASVLEQGEWLWGLAVP